MTRHRLSIFAETWLLFLFFAVSSCRAALYAKGPADPILQVKSGKGQGHGVVHTSEPLELWCQAFDDVLKKPVPALNASFRHHGKYTPAVLSKDGLNASLTVDSGPVDQLAGNWTCELQTRRENVTGVLTAYVRAVVLANSTVRVDVHSGDSSKFHYDVSGITVVRGNDARFECPIFAVSKSLRILWRRGGQDVQIKPPRVVTEGSNGRVLVIKNVTDDDDATYACIAITKIPVDLTKDRDYELIVERRLRVKSELAWLLPLLIIVVCVIFLAIIIVTCEFRKRRNEQKLLDAEPEED
ncbi:Protein ZIG-1 [Aphelenchoides avenae]|nr:Protein ZIG-1 [Aphelenchus avenae]